MQNEDDDFDKELMDMDPNPKWQALLKQIKEEHANFDKTGIPRCMTCKKEMEQDGSEYCWKLTCECQGKNPTMRLCFL